MQSATFLSMTFDRCARWPPAAKSAPKPPSEPPPPCKWNNPWPPSNFREQNPQCLQQFQNSPPKTKRRNPSLPRTPATMTSTTWRPWAASTSRRRRSGSSAPRSSWARKSGPARRSSCWTWAPCSTGSGRCVWSTGWTSRAARWRRWFRTACRSGWRIWSRSWRSSRSTGWTWSRRIRDTRSRTMLKVSCGGLAVCWRFEGGKVLFYFYLSSTHREFQKTVLILLYLCLNSKFLV